MMEGSHDEAMELADRLGEQAAFENVGHMAQLFTGLVVT